MEADLRQSSRRRLTAADRRWTRAVATEWSWPAVRDQPAWSAGLRRNELNIFASRCRIAAGRTFTAELRADDDSELFTATTRKCAG